MRNKRKSRRNKRDEKNTQIQDEQMLMNSQNERVEENKWTRWSLTSGNADGLRRLSLSLKWRLLSFRCCLEFPELCCLAGLPKSVPSSSSLHFSWTFSLSNPFSSASPYSSSSSSPSSLFFFCSSFLSSLFYPSLPLLMFLVLPFPSFFFSLSTLSLSSFFLFFFRKKLWIYSPFPSYPFPYPLFLFLILLPLFLPFSLTSIIPPIPLTLQHASSQQKLSTHYQWEGTLWGGAPTPLTTWPSFTCTLDNFTHSNLRPFRLSSWILRFKENIYFMFYINVWL